MVLWKAKVTPTVTPSASRQMTRRPRSSPRCSTRVASSPCARRRGSGRMRLDRVALALGSGSRGQILLGGDGRQLGRLVTGLVLPRARVLELTHAAAERLAHLREPLRPEHEQDDDEEDGDLPRSDPTRHAPRVALRRPRENHNRTDAARPIADAPARALDQAPPLTTGRRWQRRSPRT